MDDDVANLPIDIHVGKLVDWLVSRQHSSKDWPENARKIRENINEAIQDMPEHPDITKLLSGTYINYFHCLRIVEILRETEADSKNILGWYTSQRMKDWQNVVKLYEKGGTSLAESGQLLHRYVIHEIPGIKSQINRCNLAQQECDKKEAEAHKAATNAANLYQRQVKQIGIPGEEVREELFSLVEDLPADLDRIATLFKDMQEGVQFYLDFIAFTSNGKFKDSLPMLRYVIEYGNVTTYEYTCKVAPTSVEDPFAEFKKLNAEAKKKKEAEVNDAIDFGDVDFGDDAVEEADIDFGIEIDDAGIDFGEDDNAGAEIDFGDDAAVVALDEDTTVASGAAEGKMAQSLLHNSDIRAAVLDDVYELDGFLQQRLLELRSTDESKMTLNLFDDAPKSLQMVSTDRMREMAGSTTAVLDALTAPKMVQLFLISDSHKYVERLSATLEQQRRRGCVSQGVVEALNERRAASSDQAEVLTNQLVKVQAATVILTKQLETAISERYKGRPVNIMGTQQKN